MEKPSSRRQVSKQETPAVKRESPTQVHDYTDDLFNLARDNSRKLDIIIELLTKHADVSEPEESKLAGCPCAMMRGTIMGNAYISCSSSYRTTSACTFDGDDYKQCEIYRKTML